MNNLSALHCIALLRDLVVAIVASFGILSPGIVYGEGKHFETHWWSGELAAEPETSEADEEGEIGYDSRPAHEKENLIYKIKTNSLNKIKFDIEISNHANDIWCEKSFIYSGSSVSKFNPKTRSRDFSRLGSPSIALYEWHICFIIDDIVYKAWRGFDPGFNGRLEASCFIPKDIKENYDRDKYLCKTDKVHINYEIYSEYGSECDEALRFRDCRQYESEEHYDLANYYKNNISVVEEIAKAILFYNHKKHGDKDGAGTRASEVNIKIGGNVPSPEFIDVLKGLNLTYNPESEYPYYLGVHRPWSKTKVTAVESGIGGNASYIVEFKKGEWRVTERLTAIVY